MPDNLHVDVTADTSKARHEMELLNAEMRKTQKEIKATSDAAVKTGDPKALANLKSLTAAYDGMSKKVVALRKEVNSSTQAHKEHAHGFYLVENSVQTLNGAFMALGHNIGGARAAIAGFVVGIALQKVAEVIDEASKKLTELKKTAGEIGIKPIALQAAQEVVKGLGKDAEIATRAFSGMSAQLEEIRKQSTQAPGRPSVFRGGTASAFTGVPSGLGVQTFRGGVEQPRDFSKPLEMLGIADAIKALPNSELGKLQNYIIQLKAFVTASKTFDPTALNIISKTLFQGVPADAMIETAPDLIKKTESAIAELEKSQRGATDAAIANNEALIASQAKLDKSFEDAVASMAKTIEPARIFINEQLTHFFDESAFSANLADAAQKWSAFWENLVSTAAQAGAAVKQSVSSAGAALSSAFSNAANAMTGAAAQGALVPFARGGYVRGPGSGTSDSILARLSAGEFVVNAARVRQVGLGFLQQLNGFANGGLVSASLPRFAEGGMAAAAGGGTPVHLHLDGASYAMRAEAGVAQALVVAAQRQQMRSAGIKPSWYGGRPGA